MPRAAVVRGTVVLSRTDVTRPSMRSAACTVQSSSRAAVCGSCAMGGEYPRSPMRHLLGVAAAAAAAAFGGLVLGEYELKGAMVFVAAALFGLAVGEILVAVGRRNDV